MNGKHPRVKIVTVDWDEIANKLIYATSYAILVKENIVLHIVGDLLCLDKVTPTSRPDVFLENKSGSIFDYEIKDPETYPLEKVPEMDALSFMLSLNKN